MNHLAVTKREGDEGHELGYWSTSASACVAPKPRVFDTCLFSQRPYGPFCWGALTNQSSSNVTLEPGSREICSPTRYRARHRSNETGHLGLDLLLISLFLWKLVPGASCLLEHG